MANIPALSTLALFSVGVQILLLACLATWAFSRAGRSYNAMLDKVQRAHFEYFVENQDPTTGLILDRSTNTSPASIAAVGFALTAYPVAVEHGWVSREDAATYTLKVLTTLKNAPSGPEAHGTASYHGYFYHMLDPHTGTRATSPKYWNSELSSIDTALLMAGVLFARDYYDANSPQEKAIRDMATALYDNVEWDWMADPNQDGLIKLAWSPENGFTNGVYKGYNEAGLLYILAIGSPTHPVKPGVWQAYMGDEKPSTHYGYSYIHLHGGPLFVYQYPLAWIDFRGIEDDVNRKFGFDYFENARRATMAQYAYAKANPHQFVGYGKGAWGLTASDGPYDGTKVIDGQTRTFRVYSERGVDGFDDGTIAPTAAISSLPYAPDVVLPTMYRWLKDRPELFGKYGFTDAFNPTFDQSTSSGWVCQATIGIDQGPVILMIENYRSKMIWNFTHRDPDIRNGLVRAGFRGGWLE